MEFDQKRNYAETEYHSYRQQAQYEREELIEDVKDKEIELERLRY